MICELKECPYCGNPPVITNPFGRLCIGCRNAKCLMKPDTWLHAPETTDLKVVANYWNARPKK